MSQEQELPVVQVPSMAELMVIARAAAKGGALERDGSTTERIVAAVSQAIQAEMLKSHITIQEAWNAAAVRSTRPGHLYGGGLKAESPITQPVSDQNISAIQFRCWIALILTLFFLPYIL